MSDNAEASHQNSEVLNLRQNNVTFHGKDSTLSSTSNNLKSSGFCQLIKTNHPLDSYAKPLECSQENSSALPLSNNRTVPMPLSKTNNLPNNFVTTSEEDTPTTQSNAPPTELVANCEETTIYEGITWHNQLDFLLSIIGYAVDLANVWRFPYLCYSNGGGAFLIPYFLMLIFGALPALYLELLLGQRFRRGAIGVWDICPIFRGIGIAQVTVSSLVALFYNTIIAWCLYFTIASVTSQLPWLQCNLNAGNSHDCTVTNTSSILAKYDNDSAIINNTISATEYFERVVLQLHKSRGIDDMGGVRVELLACLAIVFIVLYFTLRKGVKSVGRVVYVTAMLPYLLLSMMLINGLFLSGSSQGLKYFIQPRFQKLQDISVWTTAAVQIFFSTGAGFGVHIAYASHNPQDHNIRRDCLITAILNSFTSLFAGCAVFTYLGNLSYLTQSPIERVTGEGPGLVFQVYPYALGTLLAAPVWSFLFFLLLIMLGMDSAMGGMEAVLTGITDLLPNRWLKKRYFRDVFTASLMLVAFLLSIPTVMQGGMYVFTLLDKFAAGVSLLFTVLCQIIAVSWFYGLNKFCEDIKKMHLPSPGIYWRVCWKFISPSLLICTIVSEFIAYQPLVYSYGTLHPELTNNITGMRRYDTNQAKMGGINVDRHRTLSTSGQTYIYPQWANQVGWSIVGFTATLVLAGIVIVLVYYMWRKKLILAITPRSEHAALIAGGVVRHKQLSHWFSLGPPDIWPFKDGFRITKNDFLNMFKRN